MNREELRRVLPTIPQDPGCYQYRDKDGTIIYVGKAKNLRNRISSYFNNAPKDRKTTRLVGEIRQLEYFVVNSEAEALLLENNLIKTHKPKYNILLKDDKSYPRIVITDEAFPRVFITRQDVGKGDYYGPYPNVAMARTVIGLIHRVFQLRSCRYTLSPEVIKSRRVDLCLQYHIKKCGGPCQGLISEEEYMRAVQLARRILRGEINILIEEEVEEMNRMSERLEFERAERHKQNIEVLKRYSTKHIVAPHIREADIFAYDEDNLNGFICMMQVRHGAVVLVHNLTFKRTVESSRSDLLAYLIEELRRRFGSTVREVILSEPGEWESGNYRITVPQRGEKKQLLDLAQLNVSRFRWDCYKRQEKLNPEQRAMRLLSTMKKDLGMDHLPRHMECFDNSNIQGTNPVSACVVFKNGKPAKKEYRKFRVKTVIGADDYRTMREVIYRRYRRVLEDGLALPDLIIIDGGKGQLGVACETLRELGIYDKVCIFGLAERMEELYRPGESDPLILDRRSETLKVICHIRDEAHRFGITFHRDRRSKEQTKSLLDDIPGIGVKSKGVLLRAFHTPQRIIRASRVDLVAILGASRGNKLYNHLHPDEI